MSSKELKDIERSLIKKFRGEIWAKFVQAVDDYKLINEGDKVAVCMSGGKDSFLMAKLFQELKKHWLVKFDLVFLCMNPGYNEVNKTKIIENANYLDIPLEMFETSIFDSVNNIEDSPCYICARMRRGYLYREAKKRGCNKIALGHHFDDVIETTLMSMLYGSQVQTMVPKIISSNVSGMELIRPMIKIKEEDIIRWANYNGLEFINCACKMTKKKLDEDKDQGKRKEIKNLIKKLKEVYPIVDINIFKSMENVNLNMVLGYKDDNTKYNFLDIYNANKNISDYNYNDALSRQIALIGLEKQEKIKNSKVLIFGLGGVGSYALEAIVRSGVGEVGIVDNDCLSVSNLNRQLIATLPNIGKKKIDVCEERIKSINPNCIVKKWDNFVLNNSNEIFDFKYYDYVIDCIDTVSGKIDIITSCTNLGVKVISSMGTARKMDPTKLEITDIYKTQNCPLAKVMRHELKKRGVKELKVVYSKEDPIINEDTQVLGSVSFVPSVAGLYIASYVINDIVK